MKNILGVCLIAAGMSGVMAAQNATKRVLREGIPVTMSVASEAVAMPAADETAATVITVTAEGSVFLGVQAVELNALAEVPASTVYLKADARAPFQQVLTVLEAFHGHSVVLLTTAPAKPEPGKITVPYGVPVALGSKGSD